jgi:hypothetical protein
MSDQQIHNYGPQYASEAITEPIGVHLVASEPADEYHEGGVVSSEYSLRQLLPQPVFQSKPRLHWLQAVFYVVGIITCLVVLFAIFDAYYVIHQLHEALTRISDNFSELTP